MLILQNCRMLCTPKTGSSWSSAAVLRASEHAKPFGVARGRYYHAPLRGVFSQLSHMPAMAFVRHPLTWYKSIWSFRAMHQVRNMKFPVDRHWVPDYEEFVISMLDAYPGGFVTQLFQYYVGKNGDGLDFVGRQENLTNDLVTALTLAGETFDEDLLRGTKRYNVSRKYDVVLSKDTQNRVLEVEKWVVDNFYG